MQKISPLGALGLVIAIGIGGCATPPETPLECDSTTWTPDRIRSEFCGKDRWEGFNRAMFSITDATMDYLVPPLCTLYCSIVPRPLIDGIENAVNNSEYPARLVSTLLRGEWGGAWDETRRFAINTTLGLGGLFDPAQNWFGIFSTDSSLAGTMAAWGVDKGPPLAIPFIPRNNVRDVSGYVLDMGLHPLTYVDFLCPTEIWIGWSCAFWPNYAAYYAPPWEQDLAETADHYDTFMQAFTLKSLLDEDLSVYRYATDFVAGTAEERRPAVRAALERPAALAGRWRDIAGFEPRSPALDTLRSSLFVPMRDEDFWWHHHSIFNSDYINDVDYRELSLDRAHPAARYGFAPASEGAAPPAGNRLVFVIPGVGGTCRTKATLAMGELLNDAGVATVLCDTPFSWQYLASINHGVLPGNMPADARRLAVFMNAVVTNLVAEGLVAPDPEVSVVGWSMGGLITAHLAAQANREPLGFRTGEFLAINPPTTFEHVAEAMDRFVEPTRGLSAAAARTNVVEISRRLLFWSKTLCAPSPDLSEDDAGLVVAAVLGAAIPQVVTYAKGANAIADARRYYDLLSEEYPGETAATLSRRAGLESIAAELAANPRLTMIHTRDDFLLTESDREFLDRTLGDRITWFSAGAHCGMFYTQEFKTEVLDRLRLSPTAAE